MLICLQTPYSMTTYKLHMGIGYVLEQSVSPTLKPIVQEDLWKFWLDKSLIVVMGPAPAWSVD